MEIDRPKKRLFLSLLLITAIIIYLLFTILYLIPAIGFDNLPSFLKYIFYFILSVIPFSITILVVILVIAILRGKDFSKIKNIRVIAIKVLYPLVILIGNLIKIDIDKIRASFIEINNSLLSSLKGKFKKKDILILLPHCLQFNECNIKITNNIKNCKKCGKCKIKDILDIAENYGVDVDIATGGTLARKIVKEKKPKLIIAVACERDLASGIQDSYPLPVYGIPNKRPNGPCFNTDVDIEKIKFAINYFI